MDQRVVIVDDDGMDIAIADCKGTAEAYIDMVNDLRAARSRRYTKPFDPFYATIEPYDGQYGDLEFITIADCDATLYVDGDF